MSPITLLPPDWQGRPLRPRGPRLPRSARQVIITVVAIVVAMHLAQWGRLRTLEGRLHGFERDITRATDALQARSTRSLRLDETLGQLHQQHDQLEQRIAFLQRETQADINWQLVLDELAALLPPELWLVGVTVDNGALRIEGAGADHHIVGEYLSRLGRSPFFTSVTAASTQKQELFDQSVIAFEFIGELSVRAKQRSHVETPAAAAKS